MSDFKPRFTIHVSVDGTSLGTRRIDNPFIESETVISRRDLWRALLRGNLVVRTVVNADRGMVVAVMQLCRFMGTDDS